MKFLDLTEERMGCLNAQINEFSYDGCCRVYDFLTHDILSRFEIKEICENRHMIFFMDEEGNMLNFNVNFPEILYVEHALDKRIAYLEGNEEEYDEMKEVMSILCPEDTEEEE